MTSSSAPGTSRLDDLRDALEAVRLPLAIADADSARDLQRKALRQIDDYIAPRLANLDAPLLAVVGGSTGAGKSTIVNALVGHPVTRTGAIRPTTRQPILLHSPGDRDAFASTRILPELARITGVPVRDGIHSNKVGEDPDAALISSVVLVADERIPHDLAVLDAPDVDSIADENRALAAQLLAAADLWLFVTTANRYADAVPWRLLDDAASRDITVGVVLNRVPDDAGEVEGDLRAMLAERGLGQAPVFVIPEAPLTELGMLPDAAIAPIRQWLGAIAADRASRQEVARRTVAGAVSRLAASARTIAEARQGQLAAAVEIEQLVRSRYDDAYDRVIDATKDGTLLRGEVLARWQDFVGTSDVFRSVETWFGRARDTVTAWVQGRPAPIREVETEIEHGLHSVIVDQAGRAAGEAWQRLRESPSGRQLATDPALGRESIDLPDRAAVMIRDWQTALMQLIRDNAGSKRTEARLMSLGLNAVTVALMVALFASTGGLTGGEIAIAGGSAVVGQKLLETVFGDETIRRLAKEARADLEWRLEALFDEEFDRYARLLEPVAGGPDGRQIQDSAMALEQSLRLSARDDLPALDAPQAAAPAPSAAAPAVEAAPPAAASAAAPARPAAPHIQEATENAARRVREPIELPEDATPSLLGGSERAAAHRGEGSRSASAVDRDSDTAPVPVFEPGMPRFGELPPPPPPTAADERGVDQRGARGEGER